MKASHLHAYPRFLLLFSAILMPLVVFLPIWRIELDAPQYPEGLKLLIHANDIKGDLDIINGLNHYIGMKTMHKEDFVEFTILPYAIIAFAVVFLIGFLINKRQVLYFIFFSFLTFGVISMADFWKWEYDYGHNLDPKAAIQIPGMSYQPPFLGFKQLLNFGAFSIPDIGGWIFIGVGLMLFAAFMMEWKFSEKLSNKSLLLLLISFSILTISCKIPVKEIQLKVLPKSNLDPETSSQEEAKTEAIALSASQFQSWETLLRATDPDSPTFKAIELLLFNAKKVANKSA